MSKIICKHYPCSKRTKDKLLPFVRSNCWGYVIRKNSGVKGKPYDVIVHGTELQLANIDVYLKEIES